MRLATFNCENLFARYRFKKDPGPRLADGFTINDLAFDIYDETAKQITARTIKQVDADVIALQEVESLPVLDRFNARYLGGMKYRHRIVVDGNDQRGIDVAILSRFPIVSVRSHRDERNSANTAELFSRDCLEARVEVDGKVLTLYVNHLKSMVGGRSETKARRQEQAARVADLVSEKWDAEGAKGCYVVLGDLNDYPDAETGLGPLLKHAGLVNVLDRLPEGERWTHFYAGGHTYGQLDYLLLSPALAQKNKGPPEVMRMGLPFRADRYNGPRFEYVGEDNPKASDHAPVSMDLQLA